MDISLRLIINVLILLSLSACGGSGSEESDSDCTDDSSCQTASNLPPEANAAENLSVVTGSRIILDGSSSYDPDSDLITYHWTKLSAPTGSLEISTFDETAIKPSFTPEIAGRYQFALKVNDGELESASDIVEITVSTGNAPPIANSGRDTHVDIGELTTLDGTDSSDANNDSLSYNWSITSTPTSSSVSSLSGATTANPTFTPDVSGSYTFSLQVNDGEFSSAADAVTITATSTNLPPIANAGIDQTIVHNPIVTLDGSSSIDLDNGIRSYSWQTMSIPSSAEEPILTNGETSSPSFTPSVFGEYQFALTVNDGEEDSQADFVVITIPLTWMEPIITVNTQLDPDAVISPTALFDPTVPSSYNHSAQMTIYDYLGSAHTIWMYFSKTAYNQWSVVSYIDGVEAPLIAATVGPPVIASDPWVEVGFDETGSLSLNQNSIDTDSSGLVTLDYFPVVGGVPLGIVLTLNLKGLTQSNN
jgi:hypothetical protein